MFDFQLSVVEIKDASAVEPMRLLFVIWDINIRASRSPNILLLLPLQIYYFFIGITILLSSIFCLYPPINKFCIDPVLKITWPVK